MSLILNGRVIAGASMDGTGPFAFHIDSNGHLIMEYEGTNPPDAEIDSNGHLILDINGQSQDVGQVTGFKSINKTLSINGDGDTLLFDTTKIIGGIKPTDGSYFYFVPYYYLGRTYAKAYYFSVPAPQYVANSQANVLIWYLDTDET